MRCIFVLVFLLAAITMAVPASAKTWAVDYPKSYLGFSGKQGDQNFKGIFKKFQATIDFDPAKPEDGKITAIIDIASAMTGTGEIDGNLPQSEWFNSKQFPKAEFATRIIEADSTPSCFKAEATLTIKGISKPVSLPFCLKQEGDHMRAKGELALLRNDFSIGTGQWADEGVVANAVTVSVDIVAR